MSSRFVNLFLDVTNLSNELSDIIEQLWRRKTIGSSDQRELGILDHSTKSSRGHHPRAHLMLRDRHPAEHPDVTGTFEMFERCREKLLLLILCDLHPAYDVLDLLIVIGRFHVMKNLPHLCSKDQRASFARRGLGWIRTSVLRIINPVLYH